MPVTYSTLYSVLCELHCYALNGYRGPTHRLTIPGSEQEEAQLHIAVAQHLSALTAASSGFERISLRMPSIDQLLLEYIDACSNNDADDPPWIRYAADIPTGVATSRYGCGFRMLNPLDHPKCMRAAAECLLSLLMNAKYCALVETPCRVYMIKQDYSYSRHDITTILHVSCYMEQCANTAHLPEYTASNIDLIRSAVIYEPRKRDRRFDPFDIWLFIGSDTCC